MNLSGLTRLCPQAKAQAATRPPGVCLALEALKEALKRSVSMPAMCPVGANDDAHEILNAADRRGAGVACAGR